MPDSNDLSERELEILRLVATGASNKQIAQQLFISTNTVKVHLRNIFAKIDVVSRTEAAMYAVQMGVVAGDHSVEGGFDTPIEVTGKSGRRRLTLSLGFVIIVLLGVILFRQIQQAQQVEPDGLGQTGQSGWQEKAAMPTARFGMATAVYEDRIYAIGGETEQSITGAVERYDPQTDRWESLSPKPVAVSDVSAVVIGGLIYIPGGRLQSGTPTNLMEIFDPNADSWRNGMSLPHPISGYALVPFEGKMYLFGGWDGQRYLDTIYEYDPNNDRWTEIEKLSLARAYAGAIAIGTKIYILGGFDGVTIIRDGEIFYPGVTGGYVEAWDTGSSALIARYGMGLAEIADIVYVVGGRGEIEEGQNTVAYFHQSNEWRSIPSPSFELGAYSRLVSIGNFLYLLGGNLNGIPSDRNFSYQAIYTVSVPLLIK